MVKNSLDRIQKGNVNVIDDNNNHIMTDDDNNDHMITPNDNIFNNETL